MILKVSEWPGIAFGTVSARFPTASATFLDQKHDPPARLTRMTSPPSPSECLSMQKSMQKTHRDEFINLTLGVSKRSWTPVLGPVLERADANTTRETTKKHSKKWSPRSKSHRLVPSKNSENQPKIDDFEDLE